MTAPASNALAVIAKPQAQAIAPFRLSEEAKQVVRESMMRGASASELLAFFIVAEKMQLDPVAKQIHAVSRDTWDKDAKTYVKKWSFQTSIDGYRLIAQRTGEYEGQTKAEWCGSDGKWVDVWLDKDPPAAARKGVMRKGFREPLVAVATYAQYVQTYRDKNENIIVNPMWTKMPANQLAKCAEALALRQAFPQELSGAYVDEEMGQADVDISQHAREPLNNIQDTTVVKARATGLDYMNAMKAWTKYKGGSQLLNNACAEFGVATGVVSKGQKPTLQQYALLIDFIEANKHRPFDEAIQQIIDPRARQDEGDKGEHDQRDDSKAEPDFVA